jgi:hypothetical protein
MGCCGSSNSGSLLGGFDNNDGAGVAVSLPDDNLLPIHPSWLDAATVVNPALIPSGIERTIVNGIVDIVIYPDTANRFTIRSSDRVIRSVKRQQLWGDFPALTSSIAVVKPVVTPPVPPTTTPK